jgi:hypothetical protein
MLLTVTLPVTVTVLALIGPLKIILLTVFGKIPKESQKSTRRGIFF